MKKFILGQTVLYLTNFIIIITDGNKQEKKMYFWHKTPLVSLFDKTCLQVYFPHFQSVSGRAFLLELFFKVFFNCYINLLKAVCNLYLYQMDISSAVNWT